MLSGRSRSPVRSPVRLAVAIALWSLQALSAAHWVRSFQYADDDSGYALRLAREKAEQAARLAAARDEAAEARKRATIERVMCRARERLAKRTGH